MENILTIFGILVVICLIYHFNKKFDSHVVIKAPAILTTIGIFFTFLGIGVGLLNFDVNEISRSIPKLLSGIKTAFWVSIAGIGGAIYIKIKDFFFNHKQSEDTEGSTIDDLAFYLKSINKSLSEDDNSSLVSQIKLNRQNLNIQLDNINKSLVNFYEKIADNNSKALIEALKEVIKDFNSKINEQFGENFKHLNEAVGKILEWQERYKNDIETMIQQQIKITQNTNIAIENFDLILNKTSRFSETAESLSNLIKTLEIQRNYLQESLIILSRTLDNAGSSIPKLEEKFQEMTKQISSSVSSCNHDLKNILIEGLRNSNDDFNKNIKKLVEQTKEQVLVLDKALSDELTKSLESFGKQMASLSEKFANDYLPITDGLQRILRIGKTQ